MGIFVLGKFCAGEGLLLLDQYQMLWSTFTKPLVSFGCLTHNIVILEHLIRYNPFCVRASGEMHQVTSF